MFVHTFLDESRRVEHTRRRQYREGML